MLAASSSTSTAPFLLPPSVFHAALFYFLSSRAALQVGLGMDLQLVGGTGIAMAATFAYRMYLAALAKMVLYAEPNGIIQVQSAPAGQFGFGAGVNVGLEYFILDQLSLATWIGAIFFVNAIPTAPFGGLHTTAGGIAFRFYFANAGQ
jgi:hypothetical protein